MASDNVLMVSGSLNSSSDRQGNKPPILPSTIKLDRRPSLSLFIRDFREDDDHGSSDTDKESIDYHVQSPPIPDNQPLDPAISASVEEQHVSNALFTGGRNSVARAHLMDKMIESVANRPQIAGAKGPSCAMPGCDSKSMSDERRGDLLPCACDFKICAECFTDAMKIGGGFCPGCKEPYKPTDLEEEANGPADGQRLPLPSSPAMSKGERRLSIMRSLTRSQTGEWDHNRWLFETKGTYGYGNAIWPAVGTGDEGNEQQTILSNKPWRPLTRKLKIPAAILSPYRLLIVIRMAFLGLFLIWRINHKNEDAIWLWAMSIVCEIWFAFSWLLDQLPKLCPVIRATDLAVLKEKFETPTGNNPTGISDLPGIDVFVSTADPEKEPPLVTANTILSILAADYPVEKLACYVSDDGGALLTFEAMAEAASFANLWVPFCRKHGIEPRNPESYFSLKKDPYKNKVRSEFVKDRRRVKREYDEYKVRINGLPDSIRQRSDAFHARKEIKAMKQQGELRGKRRPKSLLLLLGENSSFESSLRKNLSSISDDSVEPIKIPKATWMADRTHWPGMWTNPSPEHTRGDHAGIIQVNVEASKSRAIIWQRRRRG